MKDNDGTPLAKKAETISYSDIYSTRDDAPRNSVNKAYAEGANYVDDPTYTEKGTKSFTQNVKDKFMRAKENIKSDVKRQLTRENVKEVAGKAFSTFKRVGGELVQNVDRNFNENTTPRKKSSSTKKRKSSNKKSGQVIIIKNYTQKPKSKAKRNTREPRAPMDILSGYKDPFGSKPLNRKRTNSSNMFGNMDILGNMTRKKKGGLF